MNDLNKFVDVWEKSKNIEALLASGIALPPSDEVQAYLASLSPTEHDRIRKSLTEATEALSAYTDGMEKEALSLKQQIDQNIQVSNACLVYNNTPGKPRE